MQAASLLCPHCQASLRLRDRTLVGKPFDCPDCGEELLVVLDDDRRPVLQPAAIEENAAEPAESRSGALRASLRSAGGRLLVASRRGLSRTGRAFGFLATPLGAAWTAAALTTLAILIALVPSLHETASDTPPAENGEAAGPREPGSDASGGPDELASRPDSGRPTPDARRPDAEHPPQPRDAAQRQEIEARLTRLGERIMRYVRKNGEFPTGTVGGNELQAGDRFGWIARLERDAADGGIPPQWDRGWHDPLNREFVRRKVPEVLNPAIEPLTGENRYPTSHFAGVAGVGLDAPQLPAGHPRAGVFGIDRHMRPEDIPDGTSNTMAVAGIRRGLGSWAAGGRATVRPFVQEPYVNGPDGFGTGQPDGMFALMADGSVRFLARQSDPRVIEKLAAAADERASPAPHRETASAGRPTAGRSTEEDTQPVAAPLPPTDRDAPVAVVSPPRKKVDVAGALAQPIVRFEQTKPVPLQDLLRQVEEMAGVPIEIDDPDGASTDKLRMPTVLALKETTVRAILEALVERAGLTIEIGPAGITLHPRGA